MTKSSESLSEAAQSPGALAGRATTWRRRVWRIARLPLFIFVGLIVVFAAIQDNLIFPGRASQGRPEAAVTPPPGAEMVTLRGADGGRIVALFGPALNADGTPHAEAGKRPTLLFFYGNGMHLATSLDLFESFRRLGANVLIPDYPGYGLSAGSPSEAGCYAAADAGLAHLRGRADVDPDRIVVAGWSLGGAVAIDLAARTPVAGLAAFSTFSSLPDVAAIHFPWLPTGLLLRHRFESERKIGQVAGPILLAHGTDDAMIPFAMMDRLAKAAGRPVDRVAIAGAGHNDVFDAGRRPIAEGLLRLLDRP